jgi:hypothetical protein
MQAELGQPVPMDAVEASLLRALGTVFGRQVRRTGQRAPALSGDGV